MPSRATTRPKPSNDRSVSKSRKWIIISAVIASAIILLTVGVKNIDLTIHSCRIYSTSHTATVSGIVRSLYQYIRVEGISNFFGLFEQLIKSEVLNMAPYYTAEGVEGKKLLMIGGGYIPEFLKHVKLLGVQIYLLDDPKMKQKTEGLVTSFTGIPNFGRASIVDQAAILKVVKEMGVNFDGVFTLVEDEGPLTSYLAEHLNLVGNSQAASAVARNKYKLRQAMKQAKLPTPKFYQVEKEEDLEKAVAEIGLPIFLKPVYGVAASFAAKADTMDELRDFYREFQKQMNPTSKTIYNFGTEMILEEVLDGPEIQLELMFHRGKMVFDSFSSEYSPKREWLVFPVNLTETQKSELLDLARRTVHAIGLTDGVVHIEMFYTSKGPQIIEVNNRLSRGFLPRRFSHQLFFGERLTDYFGSVVYLALGQEPPSIKRKLAPLSIALFLDDPSLTGWETEGGCAIFFGDSPADSLQQGRDWKQSRT